MFADLTATDLVVVFASMLVSIPIHEAMHAYAAHLLGDTTAEEEGRLTLNPLKHIDILTTVLLPVLLIAFHLPPIFVAKPVPFNPGKVRHGSYGAALVGLAGPATNLAMALVAALFIKLGGGLGAGAANAALIFMQINLALFVFNMIPFPPLDGSRLLYALAPEPIQRIMYGIESAGLGVTLLIFLVLSPFIVPVLGNIENAIATFLLR